MDDMLLVFRIFFLLEYGLDIYTCQPANKWVEVSCDGWQGSKLAPGNRSNAIQFGWEKIKLTSHTDPLVCLAGKIDIY